VGHTYTLEAMVADQGVAVEQALAGALNLMEESALAARRLAERTRRRHHPHLVERFEARANERMRHPGVICQVLESGAASTALDSAPLEEADKEVDENVAAPRTVSGEA
jgi:hypothetical protein